MLFVMRDRCVKDDKSLTWYVVIYFAGRNMLKVRIIGSSITYLFRYTHVLNIITGKSDIYGNFRSDLRHRTILTYDPP